jgi:hypothetical protein
MLSKPLEIPGGPIRPPSGPGKRKCPHCKRNFSKFQVINGKTVCPHCKRVISHK